MNVALEMINEAIKKLELKQPENSQFVIDNDEKAEWALAKIREEQAEALRIMNVCKSMILHYEQEYKKAEEDLEKKTAYLKGQLEQYFDTIKPRKTKTQEVYKLPSGKLRRKYPSPQFKRDNDKLIEWLENSNMNNYVQVKKSPKWGELKKLIQVVGSGIVCTDTGEIIEGVEVVGKPPVFEVEV